MLELREVCCAYGSASVLTDISLCFEPGEILCLIGPNGSGKSTLLRTAMGLQPRTSGEILLDDRPLESLTPREIAQKISYLPQFRNVPDITVKRLVMHGRFPYMSFPRHYTAEDHEIVARALEQTEITDLAERPLQSLSGGQRQKVYLAMILAQATETVLLDEPTTYLDIRHQILLTDMARTLADEGKAVVLVLHELPLAFRTADRLALLDAGRITALGTPERFLSENVTEEPFGVTLRRVPDGNGWQYYYKAGQKPEG